MEDAGERFIEDGLAAFNAAANDYMLTPEEADQLLVIQHLVLCSVLREYARIDHQPDVDVSEFIADVVRASRAYAFRPDGTVRRPFAKVPDLVPVASTSQPVAALHGKPAAHPERN